jgi:hypothetical protein
MVANSEPATVTFAGACWGLWDDGCWYPMLFSLDAEGRRIFYWPHFSANDVLGESFSLHPDRIREWDDRGDARITSVIEGSYYRNALLMLPSLRNVLAHRVRGPPKKLSRGSTPAGRSTSSPAGRRTPTNTTAAAAVVGPKAKNKRKAAASPAATPSKIVRMGRVQPVAGWTPDPHSVPDALDGMKHAFNAAVQAAGTTPHCTLPTNAEPTVPCCS